MHLYELFLIEKICAKTLILGILWAVVCMACNAQTNRSMLRKCHSVLLFSRMNLQMIFDSVSEDGIQANDTITFLSEYF